MKTKIFNIILLFSVTFFSITATAETLGGYDIDLSKEEFLKAYPGFECDDYAQGLKDQPETAVINTECHKPDTNFPDTYQGKGFLKRHRLASVHFYDGKIVELVIRVPTGITTKMASEQLAKKAAAKPIYLLGKTPPIERSYIAGAGGVCAAQYTLKSGLVYSTALPVQGKVDLAHVFEGEFEFYDEDPRCEQVMNSEKAASIIFYVNPAGFEKRKKDIEAKSKLLKQKNQTGFKF